MTDPRYRMHEFVFVSLPNGTRPLGRIFGFENGQNLYRFGGPFPGTAYHVELPGHDYLSPRSVVAGEEALGALLNVVVDGG